MAHGEIQQGLGGAKHMCSQDASSVESAAFLFIDGKAEDDEAIANMKSMKSAFDAKLTSEIDPKGVGEYSNSQSRTPSQRTNGLDQQTPKFVARAIDIQLHN